MLISTRVGRLFVRVVGDGPPVVMWPSLLTEGSMWREQIEPLSRRFRLHVVDPPGHGRSERTTSSYTMDDCVLAAEEVLASQHIDRAAWLGLSWGGMVGMRLAARRPALVRALALLDTSARAEVRRKKMLYGVELAVLRVTGPIRPLIAATEPVFLAKRTIRERRDIVDWLVSCISRIDDSSLVHAMDAVMFQRRDCTHELASITAPTLVLVGDEDRATPPAESERLANAIRNARLVRIPDAGHLAPLERPDLVTPELERFLVENAS